jgi:hypothetical protein
VLGSEGGREMEIRHLSTLERESFWAEFCSLFLFVGLNLSGQNVKELKHFSFLMRSDFQNRSLLIFYIHMSVHRNIITNYTQQDATFLNLFTFTDALHVSGGFSAHHQEHITVHTVSVIVN